MPGPARHRHGNPIQRPDVVHTAGAAAAFPLAGALTATAILFGLSRKAFRGFAAEPGT